MNFNYLQSEAYRENRRMVIFRGYTISDKHMDMDLDSPGRGLLTEWVCLLVALATNVFP